LAELVALAHEQYDAAAVRAFVPLLVEKQVATTLRRRLTASMPAVRLTATGSEQPGR
jgi:hypothetical protein